MKSICIAAATALVCVASGISPSVGVAQEVQDTVILDYPEVPHPEGWKIEGYAFGTREPDPKRRQCDAIAHRNQRQYQSGKMTSPKFVVEKDYLSVVCSGVFHPTRCAVVLVVDGKDVRGCSPELGYGFLGWDLRSPTARLYQPPAPVEYWFDLRELKGKTARIELRDDHFNGYLDVIKITATNRKPPADAKLVTNPAKWLPDSYQATINGDYLLLPMGPREGTPLQEIIVEIDEQEKLRVDLPLAFGDIPIAGYHPVYDLTGHQGKALKVSFHSYQGQDPFSESTAILMQREIPGREVSDDKPAFHIHNRIGLLNDPNGLVYVDGVYHIFHQYNYNVTACSWAHYTSTDLVHWEERPIGLFHDEFGSMHSGSAAVDVMNTSGWQQGDIPPVIAAYTASRAMADAAKSRRSSADRRVCRCC